MDTGHGHGQRQEQANSQQTQRHTTPSRSGCLPGRFWAGRIGGWSWCRGWCCRVSRGRRDGGAGRRRSEEDDVVGVEVEVVEGALVQLRALLAEVEAERLVATDLERAHLAGAVSALESVLVREAVRERDL